MPTATAKALGLKVTGYPMDLIEGIRKGLKKEAADYVAGVLEVGAADISRFLHVSPRTLHRYKPGEALSLDASDHLIQVYKVYARAVDVFGDKKKALRWLKYPSVALGS